MQIEQIDRDAAERAWAFCDDMNEPEMVQLFAEHRLSALSARPDDSAVERIVDAVIDAANIVSHDGYYEIDRDSATRAAIAALGTSPSENP